MSPPLTQATLVEAVAHLTRHHSDLNDSFQLYGIPPLWDRPTGFSTLVHTILEQQVSLASAAATFSRLKSDIHPFTPAQFIKQGPLQLQSLGVTRQKAGYCLNLAEAIQTKDLELDKLKEMDDIEAGATLMKIKGIGFWTARIYLLMALLRPDIWPVGDIALAEAVRRIKGLALRPSQEALSEMAEKWRPFRSVAARILWHHYLKTKKGRTE